MLEGLKGEGGTVLKTSLDHTKEAALQAAWLASKRPSALRLPDCACRRLWRYRADRPLPSRIGIGLEVGRDDCLWPIGAMILPDVRFQRPGGQCLVLHR